jgi:hypothetical protein
MYQIVRFIIVFTQLRVAIATNSGALTHCMYLNYVLGQEQSDRLVSPYRVYSVRTGNILTLRYEEQYKGDCLRLIICACYLWEMASNVILLVTCRT